jgi:hypothetical protein
MTTSYHQLFRKIPATHAPAGLSDSVMLRIEAYEMRRLRIRTTIHGIFVLAALILCIPVSNYIAGAIAQSGFGTYLSIAFSDSSFAFSHFKDFMLTLADTLPATGAIAILAIALIFANSLGRMLKSISSLTEHRRRIA